MLTVVAGFSVRIDDLRAAAATFDRLRADLESALAAGGLGETGGMAGRDSVLAAWRARYDATAAAQWAASTTAVYTLGAIATKLADTADTYLAAEHDATTRMGGRSGRRPVDVKAQPGGAPGRPGPPPPSTGTRGPDVPDALAAYYPGGDPERLRAAAAYWSTLAERMGRIAAAGDAAFRRFTATGDGMAFSAMRTFWATRFTPCATEPLFNAVVDGAGVLRDACGALAELIERTRTDVRSASAEAVEDMAPLELPAKLLNKLAWNIPELELLVGTGALAVAYLDHARGAYRSALDRQVERLRPEHEQQLRRVAVPPAPDAPVGVGLTDVGQISGLEVTGTAWDTAAGAHPTPDTIHITSQQVTHILVGDKAGGGHAPGAGFPGKTEFPRGWGEPEIVAAALSIARDPETLTRSSVADRWEATGIRLGVRIRVIVADDGYVVTAIPLAGPGVVRNPR